MKIRMKREVLLAELKAKLPAIEAYDAEVLAKHRQKNREVAKARREALRQLIKLDDDALAEMDGFSKAIPGSNSCPRSDAKRLAELIGIIQSDSRQVYQIEMNTYDHHGIAPWLRWVHPDQREKMEVC